MANALGDPVSLVGPQPDASGCSDYPVPRRPEEATDFAGDVALAAGLGVAIIERDNVEILIP
jgi:hypothetical protein